MLIDKFTTMSQCKINVTRCERLNVIRIVGPLFPKFSQKKKPTEMKVQWLEKVTRRPFLMKMYSSTRFTHLLPKTQSGMYVG